MSEKCAVWDGWVLLQQHKICVLGFVFTFLEVRLNFPYTHGFWSSLFREVVEYWGPADTGLLGDESSEGQWCMGSPPHSCGENSQFLLLWSEFTVLTPLVRILLLFSALLAENWCNQICSEDGKGKI